MGHGLLTVVAYLVWGIHSEARASVAAPPGRWSTGSVVVAHVAHGHMAHGHMLCHMWDLPGPGIKPVYPALAGGFFTTEPPGKPKRIFKNPKI